MSCGILNKKDVIIYYLILKSKFSDKTKEYFYTFSEKTKYFYTFSDKTKEYFHIFFYKWKLMQSKKKTYLI